MVEAKRLDDRVKSIWRRVFSLPENSTVNILVWMTGVPPPSITLVLNMLSLFWNVWQHDSPCKTLCINILKNKPVGTYWINMIENICRKYLLPSPLFLLQNQLLDKNAWKKLCKEKILKEENDMLIIDIFKNNYFNSSVTSERTLFFTAILNFWDQIGSTF